MSEYIKSPDGGFLLKDDQINIEKDELNRPVVNLTTAPPQVSDETDGKVLTNDGENVSWSKGLGVTLEFEPVEMPIEPKFVVEENDLNLPIPFILTNTISNIDGYTYDGFYFESWEEGGYQSSGTIYNVIAIENPNLKYFLLLQLISNSSANRYRFYDTRISSFIGGTFGDSVDTFIGGVYSGNNLIDLVAVGKDYFYSTNYSETSSTTTSLDFTKKELPVAKNWTSIGYTTGDNQGAPAGRILVAKDFNGFVSWENWPGTWKVNETNFPCGDLIITNFGSGYDGTTKIVTISSKEPVGTFASAVNIDTWQPTVLPFNGKWSDLQYFNYDGIDVFIAADLNSNKFIYTSDGINWKVGELPFAGCIGFGAIPNGIAAFSPNGYGYCFFNPFIKEYDFTHWYSGYPHEVVNSVPLDFFYT